MSPGSSLSLQYLLLLWSPICTPLLCRSLSGAKKWAPDAHWAEIRSLQKLLAPRPEKSKIRHKIDFFKKTNPFRKGSNVWSIQWYQKTYLEISWDYPFNVTKLKRSPTTFSSTAPEPHTTSSAVCLVLLRGFFTHASSMLQQFKSTAIQRYIGFCYSSLWHGSCVKEIFVIEYSFDFNHKLWRFVISIEVSVFDIRFTKQGVEILI
jgi:hypothetical protein